MYSATNTLIFQILRVLCNFYIIKDLQEKETNDIKKIFTKSKYTKEPKNRFLNLSLRFL